MFSHEYYYVSKITQVNIQIILLLIGIGVTATSLFPTVPWYIHQSLIVYLSHAPSLFMMQDGWARDNCIGSHGAVLPVALERMRQPHMYRVWVIYSYHTTCFNFGLNFIVFAVSFSHNKTALFISSHIQGQRARLRCRPHMCHCHHHHVSSRFPLCTRVVRPPHACRAEGVSRCHDDRR